MDATIGSGEASLDSTPACNPALLYCSFTAIQEIESKIPSFPGWFVNLYSSVVPERQL